MYTPKNMPEIEVHFYFAPAEYERGYQVQPPDIEILHLEINGDRVSDYLEEHLVEVYGDDWCREIIRKIASRRRVA